MLELLRRAQLIGQPGSNSPAFGPLTGPADLSGENVFEKSFFETTESPAGVGFGDPVPPRSRTPDQQSNAPKEAVVEVPEGTFERKPNDLQREDSNDTIIAPRAENSVSSRRAALKRTYTDIAPLSLQDKLTEALARPYMNQESSLSSQFLSPTSLPTAGKSSVFSSHQLPDRLPHGEGRSRWTPANQAIFTTEAQPPWTITAANDLACLVFGVTRAEVRKLGILEVVREERRRWLEEKLLRSAPSAPSTPKRKQEETESPRSSASPRSPGSPRSGSASTPPLSMGNGVTARLLSKPSWRQTTQKRRAQTNDGIGSTSTSKQARGSSNHQPNKSRGVLLCGDVVPIQKRNGAIGSASLWVKEKRGGLIWVLEEIAEDVAYLCVDGIGCVTKATGAIESIWGTEKVRVGMDMRRLTPGVPKLQGTNTGALDYDKIFELRRFTARTANDINIPVTVDQLSGEPTFRVSSFPYIAGIMVLNSTSLQISSSNSVFSGALFGKECLEGTHITKLIPGFDEILNLMTEEDNVSLVDGIFIPEHSFRKARALLAIREGRSDAAAVFLRPSGLPARHRDGAEIMVDVQMRVVKSESAPPKVEEAVIEEQSEEEEEGLTTGAKSPPSEIVYALWITYSRQVHAVNHGVGPVTPILSRPGTPPHQPSPGQTLDEIVPEEVNSDGEELKVEAVRPSDGLREQLDAAASEDMPSDAASEGQRPSGANSSNGQQDSHHRKTINDFIILEEMGQGAYGQVKLARYRGSSKKVVIKYVTKRRILVDTWARDRRLGTVPLEIHVLDYLRRDGLKHPNVVEMADFFEDDVNYYIEMLPHGLPGMDLFDYIELRVNMEEAECRSIFVQVANAVHHLHVKAKVVHRDIKDENVILDGEGNIKLIDFGSAAYIKNGPFDVFVGTIGRP